MSMKRLATWIALATTWVLLARDKATRPSAEIGALTDFAQGMFFSFVATCGNVAVGLFRKQFAKVATTTTPAHQVGVASLIQGFVALLYCQHAGASFSRALSMRSFAAPAMASSVLNAVTKTFETRAYATTDVSLCAPFLAFDPVMQFLFSALVAPLACAFLSLACDEVGEGYPAYHPSAVLAIALGAFLLTSFTTTKTDKPLNNINRLPLGSKLILLNCVIYSITSRLDKAAIRAADKTIYYTYGRLVMAATCFARNHPSRKVLAEFAKPKAALLMAGVCLSEAVYMLALYQAFSKISPVYVTAVKRGGGLFLSSLAGALFFSEPLKARAVPILAISLGVLALCL